MSTVAVSREQPVFSPSGIAAILGAIGLLAWIVQYDVDIPSAAIVGGLGVAGLLLMFTGFVRPQVPFLALVAYVPFSRVLAGDFGELMTAFNLTNILMVVIAIGYLMRTMAQHRPLIEKSGLNFLVLLFCALGSASLLRGVLAGYGEQYATTFIVELKRWLTPVLLYFIAFNVVRDRRTIQRTVIVIMMVVAVVALMAIKDYIDVGPNSSLEKSRVGGIAEQPNTLGAFFVYYMFLFASFWLANYKKTRYWGLLLPLLACFRGIQVTFSRGAYVACAAGALGLTFFRNKLLFLGLVLLMALAVANPRILPEGIAYRIEQTLNERQPSNDILDSNILDTMDTSALNRLRIWDGALKMIAHRPWWGVGYGVFPYAIGLYAPGMKGADAHNSYLLIAAEMGIPTLVAFLLIVVVMMWKSRWLYRHGRDPFFKSMALGWLGGLSGLLIANMFGSRLHSEEITSYFWIICALIMRAIVIERQQLREARSRSVRSGRSVPSGQSIRSVQSVPLGAA